MAVQPFLNWVEGKAEALRQKGGASTFAALDPRKVAAEMKVSILAPADIPTLDTAVLHRLLVEDSSAWSAGTLHLPGGKTVVVLNPTHNTVRQRVSLMEELSHVFLGHKPSQLFTLTADSSSRTYNKTSETQAYWVAAASLLPRRALKGAKTLGLSKAVVAERYGVSEELVSFRENILHLHL